MSDEAKALVERAKYCAEHGLFAAAKAGKVASYDELADLIETQAREIERLRGALKRVLPYVATQAVGCHGEKCREPWCHSCNDEDEAQIAASIALTAYQDARAALAGDNHDQ